MINLIAIDLDGTLFNSQQQITEINKSAVRKALDAGIQTTIVTGRGKAGAEMALDMLGMDMPYICSAGSLICSGKGDGVISARSFQIAEELLRIVSFARNYDAGLIADSLDGNWWFGPSELDENLDPLTAAYAWKSRRTFEPEKDFLQPMLKITLAAEPEILHLAEEELCKYCPSLHHVYAGMRYIDLTRYDVNKGSALEILADHLNISADETAAIGDQPIDISMLEYARLSIAMANAPEGLKRIAYWVAPSNDEDGVAWAIEKIISIQYENN
jgi:Cof subfamily protein (haloacid dehalogenase superfamily)